MRPELKAFLDGDELAVIGDGALMAALGQARSHTMRDIVASIQAEQDLVIRAPAASVTYVEGGPGTRGRRPSLCTGRPTSSTRTAVATRAAS